MNNAKIWSERINLLDVIKIHCKSSEAMKGKYQLLTKEHNL